MPQSIGVDARGVMEDVGHKLGADESLPSHGSQFSHGLASPRHDEGLARLKAAHDVAAGIAELSLTDGCGHTANVAPGATEGQESLMTRGGGLGFSWVVVRGGHAGGVRRDGERGALRDKIRRIRDLAHPEAGASCVKDRWHSVSPLLLTFIGRSRGHAGSFTWP